MGCNCGCNSEPATVGGRYLPLGVAVLIALALIAGSTLGEGKEKADAAAGSDPVRAASADDPRGSRTLNGSPRLYRKATCTFEVCPA